MTAVLPSPADSRSCFSPDPVGRRPIAQRYYLEHPDDAMSKPLPQLYTSDYPSPITCSAASSSPSSPNLAPNAQLTFPPTPAGSISSNDPGDQDELLLPLYDSASVSEESNEEPNASPDLLGTSSADSSFSTPQISAADDSLVDEEPSRHVDYLSHEWKEEDIWASWRYVVAHR